MGKTVAYYRSSTDLQENSIGMQQDRAHAYALENVIAIDHEYTDEAVSARKNTILNRPDMNKMVQEIRVGRITRILVYKRDRLARNAVEYMEFYRLCRKHRVEILFTAKNEFPIYYTPLGEFIELIMSGMVQHEAEQIAERLVATHMANFVEGKTIGPLPYGLKEVKSKKVLDVDFKSSEFQSEITEIFNLALVYAKKCNTLKDLMKAMDTKGFVRKPSNRKNAKRTTGPWTEAEAAKLLTNPIYMGVHRRKFGQDVKEKVRERCKVISQNDWEFIQHWIQPYLSVRREPPDYHFILDGLIVCDYCQRPMSSNFHWRGRVAVATYDCRQSKKQRKVNPLPHKPFAVPASVCHDEILKVVINHVDELLEKNENQLLNSYKRHEKQELLQNIREKEKAIQELERQFVRCVTTQLMTTRQFMDEVLLEPLREMKQKLDEERKELQEKKQKLNDYALLPHVYKDRREVLTSLSKEFADKIQEMSDDRKRELLAELIEQIAVSKSEIHVRLKHPFWMLGKEGVVVGLK